MAAGLIRCKRESLPGMRLEGGREGGGGESAGLNWRGDGFSGLGQGS